MLESTLSAYFFLLLPTSLIKGLLKTVKTKRGSISGIGVESPGFLSHVSMTDGKCFRGKSTQVAAKNSMCKCTWQVQEKKTPLPPAWDLSYSIPLWVHDMSFYFDNVSWQAQVWQFNQQRVHLHPRCSSLQTSPDYKIWFCASTSLGDALKYNKVIIFYFIIQYYTKKVGWGPKYIYAGIFQRVQNILWKF